MFRRIILAIMLILLLCGCGPTAPAPEVPPVTAAPTEAPTLPPTETPTEPPTEAPTAPPHSELYLPGVPVEDVLTYFNEVCLNAEYVNSGDPSFLQRWNAPISYVLLGDYTPEDAETVADLAGWLNTQFGFPGMYQTDDAASANLAIHFCDPEEIVDRMGDNFHNADGAVTFWYLDNVIYDAIICIRSDVDQRLRNSVILEEIYNGLGPIQDTALRPDSIIYSEFSTPQALTEMDKLILKLLYHPDLSCGMSAAECEAVIRQLYY